MRSEPSERGRIRIEKSPAAREDEADIIDPMTPCSLCVSLELTLENAASEYLRTRNQLQALPESDARRSKAGFDVRRSRETLMEAIQTFNEHKGYPHPGQQLQ